MRLKELVCGELSDLLEKVRTGQRLGRRDFLKLWSTKDLTGPGAVANFARERISGCRTLYRRQLQMDCTGRPTGLIQERGDQNQPCETDDAARFVEPASTGDGNPGGEILITGGLTAEYGIEELRILVRRIRNLHPVLHLRAFSWAELHAAGGRARREPATVLSALVEAGVDSLAGGALDDPGLQGPEKGLTAIQCLERYVPWMRAAAELGLRSGFAWLTADDDDPETLADFLLCVRELQDRWTVFEACTPLPVQPLLEGVMAPIPTGFSRLRAIIAARLFLDSIPRIQSPILAIGESVALTAQWYGADDVGGISFRDGPDGSARVAELIRNAGREPVDLYAGVR